MLHRPFREYQQLKAGCDTFAEAFAGYLQSGGIPPSLEDDLYRLQQQQQLQQDPSESGSDSEELSDDQGQHNQAREEWMLLCSNLQQSSSPQTGLLRHSFILTWKRCHVSSHMPRRMLSYKYPLQLLILNACKVSSDWCTMQFIVTCRQNILSLCG